MNSESKISRRFMTIWIGQLFSMTGSGLTAFTLGVFVFNTTHSAAYYSFVILFTFVPSFLLLPITGVLADKLDRRKLMIIGDLGAISGILFILIIMYTQKFELWHIYLGVTMSSLFGSVQIPAYKAIVTDLVDKKLYSKASGLIQFAGSAQYLVSPMLAGVLVKFFDIKIILIIDIATFILAAVTVFIIKKQDMSPKFNEKVKFKSDIADSINYLRRTKGVMCLVILMTIVCFYIALLQTLFGPMMLTLTNTGTMGTALSISASGMLLSSFIISTRGIKKNLIKTLSVSLSLAGLFYSLMGLFANVSIIIIFGFLFFSMLPFVDSSLEVLIRRNVNNEKQGRVWAIIYSVSQAGYLIAYATAGYLADNVFCPMFYENGALFSSLGALIGTGQGRGIGFMFIISGLAVTFIALTIKHINGIKQLDANFIQI